MDYNIRNKDITKDMAVDVKDTKQLSSESHATKAETNSTAQTQKPAFPKGNLGGWNTNK
jgi:hypothetical protein